MPKSGPGMVLGDLGAPFGVLRAIFKEFLRSLARRWAQDGRSWGQVGNKLRPRWAKIAPSWRSWAQLGRFWEHVGSILGVFWHMGCMAENLQQLKENIVFLVLAKAICINFFKFIFIGGNLITKILYLSYH